MYELSKGNPGALSFLVSVFQRFLQRGNLNSLEVVERLTECGIRGTDLYVLWADLCQRDHEMVEHLVLHSGCPDKVLKDACSKQDYSGRAIVAPYLASKKG